MFDKLAGEREDGWLIVAVRRRWWVVALVGVVAALAGYFFAHQQTKEYTATSALLFLNSPLDQELLGKQIVTNIDPTRQAATNQNLVELPTVSRRVAGALHLSPALVKSEITFGSDSASDVMTINATDASPQLAAKIANTYSRQYIAFRKNAAIAQLTTAQDLISSKLRAIPAAQLGGQVAQALIADRNELDLLSSAQTGDAQVVETARPPSSPSSPKPAIDGVLGLLLGLLVGGGLVVGAEWRDWRIKSIEQVEDVYDVPVIGTVPEAVALRKGGVGSPREQEAFLMIRAQLRYFDVDRHIRRVLVASADTDEGKSLVSLNLARAAAHTEDKRALLIEADLRLPTLHKVLGRGPGAGLAELLSHSQDLETGLRELVVTPDQIGAAGIPLDILMAGSLPPNPAQLLESRRMHELLEAADQMYDIVVIDTPPMGIISDAIPLVHQVDGLLVVSRLGISRRDHAVRLMKRLRSLNAEILGVVVNSYGPADDSDYGYYRYGSKPDHPERRSGRGRGRAASTS